MKRSNKLSQAVAVGIASLAFPLLADAASHRKIVYIDQYDQNFDGKVSSVEFEMARRNRFDITDSNHDGEVDAEEYVFEWEDRMDAQLALDRRGQVDQTATRFDSLDDNADAVISWSEFEASGERSFSRFDSNEDGVINSVDVDGMAEMMSQNNREMTREQILVDQKRMLEMPSTHSKEGTITQYDRNDDEVVTHEEFVQGRTDYFQAMDANSDGDIVEEEYLFEFEDRMDAEITRFRKASVEQAYVRFNALDDDENEVMSYEEYQDSGHGSFSRWDTDGDGYISFEEEDPVRREHSNEDDQSPS